MLKTKEIEILFKDNEEPITCVVPDDVDWVKDERAGRRTLAWDNVNYWTVLKDISEEDFKILSENEEFDGPFYVTRLTPSITIFGLSNVAKIESFNIISYKEMSKKFGLNDIVEVTLSHKYHILNVNRPVNFYDPHSVDAKGIQLRYHFDPYKHNYQMYLTEEMNFCVPSDRVFYLDGEKAEQLWKQVHKIVTSSYMFWPSVVEHDVNDFILAPQKDEIEFFKKQFAPYMLND